MRIPERGEKGFTLIELLIVVAILGVLAAVVIPNVGRFIGRGESEAADTEFSNIQTAVVSMMVDNGLSELPAGYVDGTVIAATDNM
ncbi:MAG TPA: prepilin-type N-terminal cleavage/methylation domain-containing protein, partial [Dehalococcoidales bacterium]|nr:prepilin-type N-terminal cleavage/methylation domain-containing protein [Dehalococcoidales bacterium]